MTDAVCEYFLSVREGNRVSDRIPASIRPASLDDGYAAQADLAARLLERRGGSALGYKAACTNTHAQELLGTDGPVFGRLFSHSTWTDGAEISAASLPMLVVEAEFAFEMAEDVPADRDGWTGDSISEFVGNMLPAIELVGHRFADWSTYDAPSLAADNAVHLGWVHGEPASGWRNLNLADCPVELCANGRICRTGSGALVLGHPMNVIAWLANALPGHGLSLRAGDLITTGVSTDIYPASRGERVCAEFGPLGRVCLTFVD